MDSNSTFLYVMMNSYKRTLANDARNGTIPWAVYHARIKKAEENVENIRQRIWTELI